MALILFLIPAKRRPDQAVKRTALLDAAIFTRIPWHIILLFGGGFALARGFQESGLSLWIGARFAGIENAPTPLLIASVSGGITFLTELTSNTATTQMILPPLASTAVEAGIHPLMLMVPAALAASCAFMMPVATPPNAIVFASGRLRIIQMVKAGLILNLLGVVVITTLFLLLGPAVFDIDREALPDWARQP